MYSGNVDPRQLSNTNFQMQEQNLSNIMLNDPTNNVHMQQPMYPNQQPMMQPMYPNQQPMMQPMYPNQQPMMQPGYSNQPMMNPNNWIDYRGRQMAITPDPLSMLSQAKSAYIEQQIELLEVITGCETANRYHVYITTHTGELVYLFKCKEQSSCWSRNCCSPESRPFNMKVRHVSCKADYLVDDYSSYWAMFERPFKCTCCCLGRPEMTAGSQTGYFGKVVEPCTCIDPLFHIYNNSNNLRWKISANGCQCGICCRAGVVGKCSEAHFEIYTAEKENFDEKLCDGSIRRLFSGLVQELVSDADNFVINFPLAATPEEKLMLIGTTLMIDYRYFEDNGNQDKRN